MGCEYRSLTEILPLIESNDCFVIYGEQSHAAPIADFVHKKGKAATIISPSEHSFSVNSGLGKFIRQGAVAIIATFDELVIGQKLCHELNLRINRDFILASHLECATLGLMDVCGFEFHNILSKYADQLAHCRGLFSDRTSNELFDKVIYLRGNSLFPETINIDRIPVNPDVHKQYARDAAKIMKMLPEKLPDQLKVAISFKLAISPYTYGTEIYPREGAMILNCGAHNGSSTGMFSTMCPSAKVFGFEPGKDAWESHKILEEFYPNVRSINLGIWSHSTSLQYGISDNTFCGSSSSRIGDGHESINVVSIDDFASDQNLTSVDLSKMDIEGAEIEALNGAREVIQEFKPDLAIAIYHKASHLWEIPMLIQAMSTDYKIYLDHKYATTSETVCFATHSH